MKEERVVADTKCGGCGVDVPTDTKALTLSWGYENYFAFVPFCSFDCLARWSADIANWAKNPTV